MSFTTDANAIPLKPRNGVVLPLIEENGIESSPERTLPRMDSVPSFVALRVTTDGVGFSQKMSVDVPDEPSSKEAIPPLFLAITIGDTRTIGEILKDNPRQVNEMKYRGSSPIHHACNCKDIAALRELICRGASVSDYDALGNTALHLAVSEQWYEGMQELLSHGASPDLRSEPPTAVKEMRLETPLHAAVRSGDLTATTLLLEHKPDLKSCDSDNATILHLVAQARSVEIVRLLVKEKTCKDIATRKDGQGNTILHNTLNRECESQDEDATKEIVRHFINSGADLNEINPHGETPLYLAAKHRLPKVVEYLLSVGATPTQVTRQGQTSIHAACFSGCASSLSHLLNTNLLNNQVTQPDSKGREPFHYAVKSSSIDCCELLLNNGDHLTRKDNDGFSRISLILDRLPSATKLLQRLFDSHVRLSNKPHHDPDFQITFDYSVLLSPEDDYFQSSLISELTTSRLEPLLKHPLLESFLYYKWQKIKKFFYVSVLIYFFFLVIHTIFIVITFGHFHIKWSDDPGNLWFFIYLHILMYVLMLIPDLIILLANFKKYMRHLETYTKFIAIFSSIFVLFSCVVPVEIYVKKGFDLITENHSRIIFPDEAEKLRSMNNESTMHEIYDITKVRMVRYAAALSSFFGWIEFMMLLGRFPSLGSYILMFTHVAKSIIKFVLAFSSLLIGFALCFMVLFYNSPAFKNFPLSIIKTLMMMIGEIEYGDLYNDLQLPVAGLISLVLFLFLVCIVMANLLIGLAVNDIPDLQRQGKIRRLAKQAAYLVSYERLFAVARNLRCFPSTLRILMASRSKIHRNEQVTPNKTCKTLKYKRCLPEETIQEAILLGNSDEVMDELNMEEDITSLFKSFRSRYQYDRKMLNKKLAQLPDTAVTDKLIKERLDQMQQNLENRLTQLTVCIQQQLQQYPNIHNRRALPYSQSPQLIEEDLQQAMSSLNEWNSRTTTK